MAKGASKGDKALVKMVSAIERKVDALTRTVPERPEDKIARQSMGNAFDERLAALQGITRRGLEADALRGATSPLGMGSYSQPMKPGRKR